MMQRTLRRGGIPPRGLFLILAAVFATLTGITPLTGAGGQPPAPSPAAAPLLAAADLEYAGAFRLPEGTFGSGHGFGYAGSGGLGTYGVAFNPAKSSLFLGGHPYDNRVAEVSIPEVVKTAQLDALNTATVLQEFADVTEGRMGRINAGGAEYGPGAVVLGGLFVHKNVLVGTVYGYYDAANAARRSHFTSGLTLAETGDVGGMFTVGTTIPGMVAGYMAAIPTEWQAPLGGPVLTGMCCSSIISRTSLGPAASVFNPDDLGKADPVPARLVLGYPHDHPSLGTWEQGHPTDKAVYNMGVEVRGLVFPAGTRSLLFFGKTCTEAKYLPGGVSCAGPYSYVWAYDANDLVTVKNGRRKPWDLKPYLTWRLEAAFAGNGEVQGAAYDPASGRIYVSIAKGDGDRPVIHVYRLKQPA